MELRETPIAGLLVLQPRRFADARGWFSETWNRTTLRAHGIDLDFVQDNHSMSLARGTIRGLHYQAPPRAQDKLVRCLKGAVRDVAVDMRPASATFGHWFAVELSADNGLQLLIPRGFLHGFATLTDGAEIAYKCTDTYAPQQDGAVRFDDPDLGIDWGIPASGAIVSDKDRAAPLLRDWVNPF
ncbi:MAG: dTDP-4-dehydrorhamnose 3,5-epimerase [Rubellimicrobium sp.]|nr:dTDP-4-dehydrorhamnose 3,5-epimerase [Rubellimicrobium sp.]